MWSKESSFWEGKRVLLTGHTGFKGGWMTLWLARLGARVFGVSRGPNTKPNLFTEAQIGALCWRNKICDIGNLDALRAEIQSAQPEIVFHLAAQPLVRKSYEAPFSTFTTNTIGTVNLLECLREVGSLRVVVVITTDKVYKTGEEAKPFKEDDCLGGHDPYSASKAAAELVTNCYRECFYKPSGIALATARAGNVIGGGDWSEDRLIPDAVRSWQSGDVLKIRNPMATRPWQHVLEPLFGYMTLAQVLWKSPSTAGAYNFGPDLDDNATVMTVVDLAKMEYGSGNVVYEGLNAGPHETRYLSLDNAKARKVLGLSPRWKLHQAVKKTMRWYSSLASGADGRDLCLRDIEEYEKSHASEAIWPIKGERRQPE